MNNDVVITCAVTGAGETVGRHPEIPVTPEQIAESALDAARAGAAIVHCHVRDPVTGKGSRDVSLYREVVARIRESDTDVVINLTAGMGGDLFIGPTRIWWVRWTVCPMWRNCCRRSARSIVDRITSARGVWFMSPRRICCGGARGAFGNWASSRNWKSSIRAT